VERAGLTNGTLYGLKVGSIAIEDSATGIASGTPFTLVDLGNLEGKTGAELDVQSTAAGVTRFNRPEDNAWDPAIFSANQYDGFTNTVRRIADLTRAFAGPVLLINGDSHVFTADNPLAAGDSRYGVATAVPNLSRVTVQGSTTTPLTEWLRLKVDASSASVFSWERNPR